MNGGDEEARDFREFVAAVESVKNLDDAYGVAAAGVRTPKGHRVVAVSKDLFILMQPLETSELSANLAAIAEKATLTPEASWVWGPAYTSTATAHGATHNVVIEPMPPSYGGALHYRIGLARGDAMTQATNMNNVMTHWWYRVVHPDMRPILKKAAAEPALDESAKNLIAGTGFPYGFDPAEFGKLWQWPLGLHEFIHKQP